MTPLYLAATEPIYTVASRRKYDAPPRSRNAILTTAGIADIAQRHYALLQDFEEVVPIVSVKYFQDYLLPALPGKSALVKRTLSKLRSDGIVTPAHRWVHWPNNPCDMNGVDQFGGRLLEDKVFAPFATMAQDIKDAALALGNTLSAKDCLSHFLCNPACVPISKSRREPSMTRPDAYALLTNYKTPIQSSDVTIPGEFKKRDSQEDKLDNYEKILWSMSYIMQEDARRRFVFGFTVENVSMRFWFLSRSEVLVSEEFNFMADHSTTIDFFLRTTFAKYSDLGFDNTMKRLAEPSTKDGSVRYEIEVRDPKQEPLVKTYRTTKLISELGALSPRGRGTRVWEVYEIDEGGREVGPAKVLKETWSDADRPIEGDNLANLSARASEMGEADEFKKYFMSMSRYGHVYVGEGKSARPDTTATFRVPRRGRRPDVPSDCSVLRVVNPERRPSVLTRQGLIQTDAGEEKDRKYSRYPTKIHHRIIYNEVGVPIFQAKSLCVAFMCLYHVLRGLALMHKLGWVHRDISYGNALLVGNGGKVTDLEYAKEETDTSVHGIRTGTVYFMSTEVDAGKYKHVPAQKTVIGLEELDDIKKLDQICPATVAPVGEVPEPTIRVQSQAETIPFRYNPFHDLESVVWLGFYLVLASRFRKSDTETPPETKEYYRIQEDLFQKLFTTREERNDLMNSMIADSDVSNTFSGLHPKVKPVIDYLLTMRKILLEEFALAEAQMTPKSPIPFFAAQRATIKMAQIALLGIVEYLKNNDMVILTEDDYKPRRPLWKQLTPKDKDPERPGPDAAGATPGDEQTVSSPDVTAQSCATMPETAPQTSRTRRADRPAGGNPMPATRTLRSVTRSTQSASDVPVIPTPEAGPSQRRMLRSSSRLLEASRSADTKGPSSSSQPEIKDQGKGKAAPKTRAESAPGTAEGATPATDSKKGPRKNAGKSCGTTGKPSRGRAGQ